MIQNTGYIHFNNQQIDNSYAKNKEMKKQI